MRVTSSVAKVYAKALLDVAEKKAVVDAVQAELQAVLKLLETDKAFKVFYESPKVSREHKLQLLERMFKSRVGMEVFNFLCLLVHKNREAQFDDIYAEFINIREYSEHKVHVYVKSAVAMDDSTRKELLAKLAQANPQAELLLHEEVDPLALGGLSVRQGDLVLDGTLKKRISDLREQILAGATGLE